MFNIYTKILQFGKNTIRSLSKTTQSNQKDNKIQAEKVNKLYEDNEYLEAYSQHTDLRVEADSKSAIGGMWEEIGQLQFDFLVHKNLQPHHKMLDLGCGTLRGGQHFIKYLNKSNYYGIDISPRAIEYAKKLVVLEGLSEKNPHLLVSENKNLKFLEFSAQKFDYIIAQSVFTHLKPEHIEECFENIGQIMFDDSVFYFTYNKGKEHKQTSIKGFKYPYSFFESLAEQYRFKLQECSQDYKHPRGQVMVELRKKL